jgi:hypothetical protein
MLRTVAAILLGYAAIFLVVASSFTLLWMGMGQERAFHPGTTQVTFAWILATLPLNLVAALLGGYVAAMVDRGRPRFAAAGLAVVILVLGVGAAVSRTLADAPASPVAPPQAGMGAFEAATLAIQPLWVAWVLPLVGAVGAWYGGRFRARQMGGRGPAGVPAAAP